MVLAAKPQLALPRDIDRAGRLNAVAVLVFGGDDQLHLTGLCEWGLAQQQATRIALAATDAAEVFGLGLVVVGVKTANHAFAAGSDYARHGLDFKCHIGRSLACQVKCQCLEFDFLAACTTYRSPAFGLDTRHHCSWPDG